MALKIGAVGFSGSLGVFHLIRKVPSWCGRVLSYIAPTASGAVPNSVQATHHVSDAVLRNTALPQLPPFDPQHHAGLAKMAWKTVATGAFSPMGRLCLFGSILSWTSAMVLSKAFNGVGILEQNMARKIYQTVQESRDRQAEAKLLIALPAILHPDHDLTTVVDLRVHAFPEACVYRLSFEEGQEVVYLKVQSGKEPLFLHPEEGERLLCQADQQDQLGAQVQNPIFFREV